MASPTTPAPPQTSSPLPGAPQAPTKMEPTFLEVSLSALPLALVLPQRQPPPHQPPQPHPLPQPPQCQALHQESPACSRSPGRARPSPRAPRRATTRESSGAPPWSTRLATMWLARDNMDSALKNATKRHVDRLKLQKRKEIGTMT